MTRSANSEIMATRPNTLLSDTGILDSRIPKWFLSHVIPDESTGCWNWNGWIARNLKYPKHGYGCCKYVDCEGKRRSTSAHRFAFTCINGPVAAELDVDHLCQNKLCVNPAHLEAISHKENIRRIPVENRAKPFNWSGRGIQPEMFHDRTRCIRGHLFTPQNTYIPKDGRRRCRECNKIRQRQFQHKAVAE